MTLFFLLCFVASVLLIGIGYGMDAGAIRAQVNGANGLPLLAALVVSAVGSVGVALVGGWFWGVKTALVVLLASVLWHWGALRLAVWALQRKASRSKAGS